MTPSCIKIDSILEIEDEGSSHPEIYSVLAKDNETLKNSKNIFIEVEAVNFRSEQCVHK